MILYNGIKCVKNLRVVAIGCIECRSQKNKRNIYEKRRCQKIMSKYEK